ncbi:c-type cytochrome [Parendozoicomonas haliclonae]|nr:c-type cytochrome [Parendozoicomonas haliclonae]
MKKLVACLLVGLGWAGLAVAGGDAAAGKEKVAICSACHGPTGQSIAPNYPHLAGQGEGYLIKQITDIKNGDRKILEMTGMTDNLSEQDIADISAFYASQPAPTGQATEASVAVGQKLWRGGDVAKGIPACSACHSPTGSGNAPAKFPALAGQSPEYIAKQLRDFREGDRVNDGETKIMRAVAEKLSNKQIDALSSYISGLR